MEYEAFIRHFERVVPDRMTQTEAERAIAATLNTLAQCIPADAAHDLAEQLPQPLKGHLLHGSPEGQALSLNEFLERAAAREGVSPSEARDHTRAVMDTVAEAVTGREMNHLRELLPEELAPLFGMPAAASWPDTHRHRPHR